MVKNLSTSAGDVRDMGWIPESGRSPGGGHSNPLLYSCLENPHGQRSLVGYCPRDHKESDTTERLSTAHWLPQESKRGVEKSCHPVDISWNNNFQTIASDHFIFPRPAGL